MILFLPRLPQISAGEFFELLRPAAWIVSAILSAFVLASARCQNFSAPVIIAWTLGTFLLPFIILPLYLIACMMRSRAATKSESTNDAARQAEPTSNAPQSVAFKRTVPLFYFLLLVSLIALYYYKDYHTVDAHLARANRARIMNQPERVIREYEEALKLEGDPHTHNLLAEELYNAGRYDEALTHFRAAERGGEQDDALPFLLARTLDKLNRAEEAATEYQKFLQGPRCNQSLPDAYCEIARLRLKSR